MKSLAGGVRLLLFVFIGEESGPPRVGPGDTFAHGLWFSGSLFSVRQAAYKLTHLVLKIN